MPSSCTIINVVKSPKVEVLIVP